MDTFWQLRQPTTLSPASDDDDLLAILRSFFIRIITTLAKKCVCLAMREVENSLFCSQKTELENIQFNNLRKHNWTFNRLSFSLPIDSTCSIEINSFRLRRVYVKILILIWFSLSKGSARGQINFIVLSVIYFHINSTFFPLFRAWCAAQRRRPISDK